MFGQTYKSLKIDSSAPYKSRPSSPEDSVVLMTVYLYGLNKEMYSKVNKYWHNTRYNLIKDIVKMTVNHFVHTEMTLFSDLMGQRSYTMQSCLFSLVTCKSRLSNVWTLTLMLLVMILIFLKWNYTFKFIYWRHCSSQRAYTVLWLASNQDLSRLIALNYARTMKQSKINNNL